MAKMNWKLFRKKIGKNVIQKLGDRFTLMITISSGRGSTGKKTIERNEFYEGYAVRAPYSSEEIKGSNTIKNGDVKFTCQFDDIKFEPSEKLDEKVIFNGTVYTVVGVTEVAPAETNIIWILQCRRVN